MEEENMINKYEEKVKNKLHNVEFSSKNRSDGSDRNRDCSLEKIIEMLRINGEEIVKLRIEIAKFSKNFNDRFGPC